MIENFGDRHNFGRQTEPVEVDGKQCFVKPRTVFWEYFFAGKDSPLVPIFRDSPFASFFGLDVSFENNPAQFFETCGKVQHFNSISIEAVKKLENKVIQNFFSDFGSLCAYAFCFGINDLNYENVLVADDGHLQMIDVENVFSKPKFLAEAGLVSAGGSFLDRGCFSSFLKDLHLPMIEWIPFVIQSYFESFCALNKHNKPIQTLLEQEKKNLNQPIRMILRNTRAYYAWLVKHKKFDQNQISSSEIEKLLKENESMESQFFPEELAQLERGDIPYFFMTLDSNELKFINSSKGDFLKITSKEGLEYLQDVVKPEIDFEWRFSEDRLIGSCLPAGLMEILWDLLPKEYSGTFAAGKLEIIVNEHAIRINDPVHRIIYIAERSYDPEDSESFVRARSEILKMKMK